MKETTESENKIAPDSNLSDDMILKITQLIMLIQLWEEREKAAKTKAV